MHQAILPMLAQDFIVPAAFATADGVVMNL